MKMGFTLSAASGKASLRRPLASEHGGSEAVLRLSRLTARLSLTREVDRPLVQPSGQDDRRCSPRMNRAATRALVRKRLELGGEPGARFRCPGLHPVVAQMHQIVEVLRIEPRPRSAPAG